MRTVGIIAEYNPFHNGHLHHLTQAKRLAKAEGAVVVMSGDFVQRGLPACVDKYRRAKMALMAGADLVVELPTAAALESAEGFAGEAVRILNELRVTDLVYGAEAADENETAIPSAQKLRGLAQFLVSEPEAYREALLRLLKTGKNFPSARQLAVESVLGSEAAALLSSPNNILGIEYEKALIRQNSRMVSHAVKRNDSGYHITGTRIRNALKEKDDKTLSLLLPKGFAGLLDYAVFEDDFSDLLSYRLAYETKESLADSFSWLDRRLAARIETVNKPYLSFTELADALTTRNTTRTSVCRALFKILLNIRTASQPLPFCRVLGLRRDSAILHEIKKASLLPLVARAAAIPADYLAQTLNPECIYALAVYKKTGIKLPDAFHAGPVLI